MVLSAGGSELCVFQWVVREQVDSIPRGEEDPTVARRPTKVGDNGQRDVTIGAEKGASREDLFLLQGQEAIKQMNLASSVICLCV
eukprot:2414875-Rhodomonas_salina.3